MKLPKAKEINSHPSDSSEQQSVEKAVLDEINRQFEWGLAPKRLKLSKTVHVQLDGLDENNKVLCEIYAHIGKPKGSQPDKVASDLLKMKLVEQTKGGSWKKNLCFVDDETAKHFQGKSWLAECIKQMEVKIHVVTLPEEVMRNLLAVQSRQKMVNKPST